MVNVYSDFFHLHCIIYGFVSELQVWAQRGGHNKLIYLV